MEGGFNNGELRDRELWGPGLTAKPLWYSGKVGGGGIVP